MTVYAISIPYEGPQRYFTSRAVAEAFLAHPASQWMDIYKPFIEEVHIH